ncbi:MAG TPA: hypothetical protein VKA27_04920, partial [Sunxiuqinia sp.]|nr:hypothetical protein [Sunxiuqinia sp.]
RTILELKFCKPVILLIVIATNRTILELKYDRGQVAATPQPSTNRTILELKCVVAVAVSVAVSLPIAPYWN